MYSPCLQYLGLSEYGAFWKCVTAGFVYTVTQFAKMIFLATFFPAATGHDDNADNGDEQGMHVQELDQEEVPFIFLMVSKELLQHVTTTEIHRCGWS